MIVFVLCGLVIIAKMAIAPANVNKTTMIHRAQFFPLNKNQHRTQLIRNRPISFISGEGNQLSIESIRVTTIIETTMLLAEGVFIEIPTCDL